jgi:hypothetical protein
MPMATHGSTSAAATMDTLIGPAKRDLLIGSVLLVDTLIGLSMGFLLMASVPLVWPIHHRHRRGPGPFDPKHSYLPLSPPGRS